MKAHPRGLVRLTLCTLDIISEFVGTYICVLYIYNVKTFVGKKCYWLDAGIPEGVNMVA